MEGRAVSNTGFNKYSGTIDANKKNIPLVTQNKWFRFMFKRGGSANN
jgi:hypothetical protein